MRLWAFMASSKAPYLNILGYSMFPSVCGGSHRYQPFSYNVVCFPQETNWKSTNCWVSKMKSDLDAKESLLVWCKMVSNFFLFCSSKCRYLRVVKEKKTKKKKKGLVKFPMCSFKMFSIAPHFYLITHISGPNWSTASF